MTDDVGIENVTLFLQWQNCLYIVGEFNLSLVSVMCLWV